MIATVEYPMVTIRQLPPVTPPGRGARDLAQACLRYESACWRGDSAREFATRLGSYWRPELPPIPTTEPDAYSPHGAGGRGISWFEKGDEVLGYIPGRRCGYRIPVLAITELARCVPQHPCMAKTSLSTFVPQAVVH
jgi:hypothetical protein